MTNHPARVTEGRQSFIKDNNKNPVKVVTNPKATTEWFGQVHLDTDASILGMAERRGEIVNFKQCSELVGDGFHGLTFPEFDRKVMELKPDGCSGKFGECWFKKGFPRRELKDDAIDRPWPIKKDVLHFLLQSAPNEEKAIGEIKYDHFPKSAPFCK